MQVTLHVSWRKYDWQDEPVLHVTQYDPREISPDNVYSGFFEMELPAYFTEPTRSEFVNARVDELRAEQGKKQAEITAIERTISELLALEYKP